MSFQHRELAGVRWQQLSLVEQLANVGSEVERALSWRRRNHPENSRMALDRALELLHFTISDPRHQGRRRELTRLREVLLDDFLGGNSFGSTDGAWSRYFGWFATVARQRARAASADSGPGTGLPAVPAGNAEPGMG